jgi:hypothetical protein
LGRPDPTDILVPRVIKQFISIRDIDSLQKKPATGELITWARILIHARVPPDLLEGQLADTPFLGALLKVREDLERVGGRNR